MAAKIRAADPQSCGRLCERCGIFMVLASKNYNAARRTDIIVRLLTCSF
jgi:hypothetical protein